MMPVISARFMLMFGLSLLFVERQIVYPGPLKTRIIERFDQRCHFEKLQNQTHFYEKIHFGCYSLATVLFRRMQSFNGTRSRRGAADESWRICRDDYSIAQSGICICRRRTRYHDYHLEHGRWQRRPSFCFRKWRPRQDIRQWSVGICRSTVDSGGDIV